MVDEAEEAAGDEPDEGGRSRLQSLYELSSYNDALVLLWLLRVCDELPPRDWAEEVALRGGPSRIGSMCLNNNHLHSV